jgi:2,4-diaminopentanoate dehydrogenase
LQAGSGTEDFVDFFCKHKIVIADAADAVGVEVNDHFVPDIEPLGVMVHGFGDQRDACHVAKRGDEVFACEFAVELAVHDAPPLCFAQELLHVRIGKFFRGHDGIPLGSDNRGKKHYAAQAAPQQQRRFSSKGLYRAHWFFIERAQEFDYRRGFLCRKNARCAPVRNRKTENDVKKKIRAIQYGVGPIGASVARLMREKQAIEIIGAIDTDPAKIGRDLGEIAGATDAPWGVKISSQAKEVLEQAADVVIHSTSSFLPKVMDQLLMCLEAESCVVSTCEELSYPFRTYPELSANLDAAAKDWGVALVGTGVNPGFVMDKLVVTLAAVSQRIEHAKAMRVVDAAKRRLSLQKKIGAGMTVEEFRVQAAAGVIKHVGLPESVAMVADSLNLPVEQITETIEPKIATERLRTEYLTVEPGQAAGVHQIARGTSKDGKELVYLELQLYVGAKDPADTISLTGQPNISLVIPGGSPGDIATASVIVNSIPAILDAPAGLRTSRDLPIGFLSPNAKP